MAQTMAQITVRDGARHRWLAWHPPGWV